MDRCRGIRVGEVILCEGGYVARSYAYDNQGKRIRQCVRDEGENHHLNFLNAIKTRKASDLDADIEEGHLSSSLSHMANISYRLGQPASGDTILKALDQIAEL